jgi:hypothetical protein
MAKRKLTSLELDAARKRNGIVTRLRPYCCALLRRKTGHIFLARISERLVSKIPVTLIAFVDATLN